MRTSSLLRLASVTGAIACSVSVSGAQPISCSAHRVSNAAYEGTCIRRDSTIGEVRVIRPEQVTPHLWKGVIRGQGLRSAASGGGVGEAELGIDARSGGALRLGRSWLELSGLSTDSSTIRFAFDFAVSARANELDASILRHARAYLAQPARWNRADTTNMDTAPTKGFGCAPADRQSMFCALYLASLEVAGDYAHFRPALNAVRESLAVVARRSYRHPLVDFNNDSTRTLSEVHAVLDAALQAVIRDRAKGGA